MDQQPTDRSISYGLYFSGEPSPYIHMTQGGELVEKGLAKKLQRLFSFPIQNQVNVNWKKKYKEKI